MNQQFIREISIDWNKISRDSYLRDIPALQLKNALVFDRSVTFFVGENGSGKSTLLEGIAVAYGFNPEGGTKNFSFSTYDSHSELHEAMCLSRGPWKPAGSYFLRAESFYNVASKAEDYRDNDPMEVYYARYGGKSLHQRSHGESFLALIQGEFIGNGLYILDEPTTGLHFADVHKLVEILQRLTENGNTVVVIEHNLDVIKTADYIVDMGPEGGDRGGTVIATGTPEEIAACPDSYTGQYVAKYLK